MAKVYVGTYKKYNGGSLKGGWLDLADYASYDDFLKACRQLHKDERDPEFMIQDSEEFPDGLDCMEWIHKDDFDDVKKAMAEESPKPALTIIDYSDKAFAVVGDTKSVKDQLKKMGGRFNSKLSCGCGWIFSNKSRKEVETFISSGEVTERAGESRKASSEGSQFIEWLNEFLSKCSQYDADYYRKNAVGAIKLHDRFYLIDKPSIENKFCFHDEGPQYEFYKSLMSEEERLRKYFKSENLAQFDNKIERITKGDEYNNDKRVWWYFSDNGNKLCLQFYTDSWGDNGKNTLCTDEEKALILKGLRFGREMMERRLDSYLKRYGVSKLHTWTYWADA